MGNGGEDGNLPEVVVEVVCARFVGFVGEDDSGTAVVVLAGGVLDEALLGWAVGHLGVVARGCVAVGVGNQDIFVTLRSGALPPSQHQTAKRPLENSSPVHYHFQPRDYHPTHQHRCTSCHPQILAQTSLAEGSL